MVIGGKFGTGRRRRTLAKEIKYVEAIGARRGGLGTFLAGPQPTWPVYLFAQLRVPSQLPELLAVSTIVLVVSVVLVVAAEVGRRASERRYAADAEA